MSVKRDRYIPHQETVEKIMKETGFNKKQVEYIIRVFFGGIVKSLKKGYGVKIYGFGVFTLNRKGKDMRKAKKTAAIAQERKIESIRTKSKRLRKKGYK